MAYRYDMQDKTPQQKAIVAKRDAEEKRRNQEAKKISDRELAEKVNSDFLSSVIEKDTCLTQNDKNESKTTIQEVLKTACVNEATVKKNKDKVPGLTYAEGVYDIVEGTRYPCDYHRYKMKDSADRRYLLLKAISEYKYINHDSLKVYQEQFVDLIGDLLKAGLIRENHLFNHYGANAYDCTPLGDNLLKKQNTEALREIAELVVTAVGTFAGKIIPEYPN